MNRKDLIFVGVAIFIVALFIVLSIIGHKPPPMTSRPEHAGITRNTTRDTCWGCHTPDSKIWERHPNKGKPADRDQKTPCSACHKLPEPQVARITLQRSNNAEAQSSWLNLQQR